MDVEGNGELKTCGVDDGCETQEERANKDTLKSVMEQLKYLDITPDYKPHPRRGIKNQFFSVSSDCVNSLSASLSIVTPRPGLFGTLIVLSSFKTKRSLVMSR